MAAEGAGGGRRRGQAAGVGLVGLGVALGTLVALAGCATSARGGDPALPSGFEALGMPDVDANALFYAHPGTPVDIPLGVFGATDLVAGASVVSVESLVNDPDREYAARVEFVDEATAQDVGEVAGSIAGGDPTRWARVEGRFVFAGRSDTGWGDDLRDAWADGVRVAIVARYPDVWETARLLPEDPPSPPVAVGFARNVTGMLDATLAATDVSLPGLASALSLIRADVIAFVVYDADVSDLPERLTREALRGSGIGVIGVSQAGYPGVVVGFLFDRFAETAGLEATEFRGTDALYRVVEGDLHLMVKAYGSSIYLFAAPTRAGAEALVLAVVRSQEARS